MSDSMKALVKKVARAMFDANADDEMCWADFVDDFTPDAKVAIRAVLKHFSEPGNVTDAMLHAAADQIPCGDLITDVDVYDALTEAMKAALEELK